LEEILCDKKNSNKFRNVEIKREYSK
jgi:hypothetical protein